KQRCSTSRHNGNIYLRHMLLHAREAVEMARGRKRTDLDHDRQFNLALTRLLEIIGEAANRVPEEERIPEIPWPQIVSLRNRLIHGYDEVDFDILWQIITYDLPQLIEVLERQVPPDAEA
ncbi:MAG: HepT-like ribonuclease domain-containing protein, partial [Terriglobia bacterium]